MGSKSDLRSFSVMYCIHYNIHGRVVNYIKENSLWPSDTIWQQSSIWVNIAWRHQAITWTNVNFSVTSFYDIHQRAIPHR